MAFVQAKSSGVLTPSATTVAVTLDSNVGTGNLLVVNVAWDNTSFPTDTISSIADTQLDTFTQIGAALHTVNDQSSAFYYARNTIAGACTVTVTFLGNRSFRSVAVAEYSGIDTVAPLDVSSTSENVAVTTGTDALTTSAVVPNQSNSLIVGMIMCDGLAGVTPGTNFTERVDPATAGGGEIEDLTQGTAASIAATWTAGSATGRFNACIAAFKAPPPPPPTVITPPVIAVQAQSWAI